MSGRLLLLLCLSLSVALTAPRQLAVAAAASSSKVVTSLPGFQGRLPFHLETGYVEVDEDNGTELFYYFVESEAGTEDAPFVLWLAGGDHCTVFNGLAFEIGPVKFVVEPYNGTIPSLEINPNSWTKVANILFVDTPVGAGFSFSRRPQGYHVGEVSTSLQLHEFLIKWISDHPKFLSSPLYIWGDSYAGKIVPFIAQKISEGNEVGRRPLLNLKGYLVGNPATGESIDESSRVPFAHGFGIISDQFYEMDALGLLTSNSLMASAQSDSRVKASEVQCNARARPSSIVASSESSASMPTRICQLATKTTAPM